MINKISHLLMVIFLSISCQPAMASLVLAPEEEEMIRWSRSADSGIRFIESSFHRRLAEEYADRSLAMNGCSLIGKFNLADRYLDVGYMVLIEEIFNTLQKFDEDEVRSSRALLDNWEVSLVFTFRNWTRPQQISWLSYMRLPDSRLGASWWRKTDALRTFRDERLDVKTAGHIPVWPIWINQMLSARSSFSGAFERTLDSLDPGFGKNFHRVSSILIRNKITLAERSELVRLGEKLSDQWDTINDSLGKFFDAEMVQAARSWSANLGTSEIIANYEDANTAYYSGKGSNRITNFLTTMGRGKIDYERKHNALFSQLSANGAQNCARFR